MTLEQAHELVNQLRASFLVEQGCSLESAADTYDDMNGNSDYAVALKLVEEAL